MPAKKKTTNGAALGFEQTLWLAADKLRGFMDPAEYKHVVLGLIFLKYISDAFEDLHTLLVAKQAEGADAEDPDEYRAEGVFWVPPASPWGYLQANAKQPTIGRLLDDAMTTIEQVNPSLKGVLPKDYARPTLDLQRLGDLIDLIGTIGLGDKENRSRDILGRVYDYLLSQFASSEGKKGGEFFLLPDPLFSYWWKCWLHIKDVYMTRAAVRVGCLCRAQSSPKHIAAALVISASTGRNLTPLPGAWQR